MKNKDLSDIVKYKFTDQELFKMALTHSSYASEQGMSYEFNNERLEFIGDAYIDAVVGAKLFSIMSTSQEGILSRARADVVCEESLANVARDIDLGKYLYLGKGEDLSGGRNKDSILADALEALIGAIILDGGYEEGSRVILNLLDQKIRLAVKGKLNKDFKTKLQEKIQEKYQTVKINYKLISETGPDHDKMFTVDVVVQNKVLGRGRGKSKAKAEQAAAQDVLLKGEI
ncbi:MAG: ribonuclease III [Clostridiales bacterium]|nr:ribonuclease III [Clostridiales bacterium]